MSKPKPRKNLRIDIKILESIKARQAELCDELKYFNIKEAGDLALSKTRPSIRRGLIQMVGDIFELTSKLTERTKSKLGLNIDIIRHFRNTASHNYGILSNEVAFMCIQHCISPTIRQNVADMYTQLQTNNE